MSCISTAVYNVIPMRQTTYSHFNVPGWNTYVQEKHDLAREAFLEWRDFGKPRIGVVFENMKRTRAVFTLDIVKIILKK